ncbi:MAG: hypothetical protein FRX48_00542 [Lasallia pustulata]|uniref:Calcineurin-like phosphoesterase domain-containing protein n=1 Tax=Lasallia pustulata TaxID=136370 RepID=A0A5M8Q0Y1_9LECA|nr:MAG: hypothetical protein FRX48_00542 [Lasallia pustulata]
MSIISLLRRLLVFLLPLSVIATAYLYLYPLFHGCAFPSQDLSPTPFRDTIKQHINRRNPTDRALPFRLLALGDPQLEGDSSLFHPRNGYFPSVWSLGANLSTPASSPERFLIIKESLRKLVAEDVPRILQSYRKQVDLFGNDYYLAHIYRTLHWWVKPTHVTVLGDLLGSQWVDDDEFQRRGWRFWQRVFRNGQRVEDEVTGAARTEPFGEEKDWERRIINVPGNHDVGYAGDMNAARIQRFEKVFGRANWEVRFRLPGESLDNSTSVPAADAPELRIVVLNSLNLDTPALDLDLQDETYRFMNDIIQSSRPVEHRKSFTILLTHLPLHKETGVCVDGPFFDFHSEECGAGVKEQNHVSYEAGKSILEGIFGMSGNPNAPGGGFGRDGVILTGHDHEGCDVYHHLPDDIDKAARKWTATRWAEAGAILDQPVPGIREITVRSMMGDFGGNAGLLSAWFDQDIGGWRFLYATCSVGTQHIWWAIHVLDIVTLGLSVVLSASWLLDIAQVSWHDQRTATQKEPPNSRVPDYRDGSHAGQSSSVSISQLSSCTARSTAPANGHTKRRKQ